MLQQIVIGIIGIAAGVCMVIYARQIVNSVGTSATAERYLGSGGSYTALRLGGILCATIFFLYMTGFLATVIRNIIHGLGF